VHVEWVQEFGEWEVEEFERVEARQIEDSRSCTDDLEIDGGKQLEEIRAGRSG
jgi:hypothetical protein